MTTNNGIIFRQEQGDTLLASLSIVPVFPRRKVSTSNIMSKDSMSLTLLHPIELGHYQLEEEYKELY